MIVTDDSVIRNLGERVHTRKASESADRSRRLHTRTPAWVRIRHRCSDTPEAPRKSPRRRYRRPSNSVCTWPPPPQQDRHPLPRRGRASTHRDRRAQALHNRPATPCTSRLRHTWRPRKPCRVGMSCCQAHRCRRPGRRGLRDRESENWGRRQPVERRQRRRAKRRSRISMRSPPKAHQRSNQKV